MEKWMDPKVTAHFVCFLSKMLKVNTAPWPSLCRWKDNSVLLKSAVAWSCKHAASVPVRSERSLQLWGELQLEALIYSERTHHATYAAHLTLQSTQVCGSERLELLQTLLYKSALTASLYGRPGRERLYHGAAFKQRWRMKARSEKLNGPVCERSPPCVCNMT